MRAVTWNVNGLRACEKKGFADFFKAMDADFFCIQETKMQESQLSALEFAADGFHAFWNSAQKTAIFSLVYRLIYKLILKRLSFKSEAVILTAWQRLEHQQTNKGAFIRLFFKPS